jgi:ketosteroid isomerase-like protein
MRAMKHAILVLALGAGCGPAARPETPATAPRTTDGGASELSSALAPLQGWLGDWENDAGSEHWIAAGGAVFGIALAADGAFEVMVVDDAEGPGRPDGTLRMWAMPRGATQVKFVAASAAADGSLTFVNDAHDFPKRITYARSGNQLRASISGDAPAQDFRWNRIPRSPAPELEAADRAFAAATHDHDVAGWVAAFDARGGMMQRTGRVEGVAAIGDAMRDLLAAGDLAWAPIASGRRGDVGFTVGKATYTGAKPEDAWRSSYVTIWKRQPDGAWKVWFDTGRITNE